MTDKDASPVLDAGVLGCRVGELQQTEGSPGGVDDAQDALQYSAVQYSTVQYSTVHQTEGSPGGVDDAQDALQYSTVQYSTVQYSTVQCIRPREAPVV